jgi:Tol biopolymer transport system component
MKRNVLAVAVVAAAIVLASGCEDLTVPGATAPVPFDPPQVSADGRYVAYVSDAEDPDPGDTDRISDVFVWDRVDGGTVRLTEPGSQAGLGGLSDDGRYVTYHSTQDDDSSPSDADVYVWDRTTGVSTKITSGTYASAEAITGDGRFVLVLSAAPDDEPGHQNPAGMTDPYVWDRTTGHLERASSSWTDPDWQVAGGDLSDDGRYVIWNATRVNDDPIPNDVYLADRALGVQTNITLGCCDSFHGSISGDGSTVIFTTNASLVPGDPGPGVVAWHRATDTFRRVTRATTALGDRPGPASANGRFVAITRADSTFPAITGPSFLVDVATGNLAPLGAPGHEQAGQPSNDGLTVPVSRYPTATPPPQSGEVRVWAIGN